jgi:hypothetical protein
MTPAAKRVATISAKKLRKEARRACGKKSHMPETSPPAAAPMCPWMCRPCHAKAPAADAGDSKTPARNGIDPALILGAMRVGQRRVTFSYADDDEAKAVNQRRGMRVIKERALGHIFDKALLSSSICDFAEDGCTTCGSHKTIFRGDKQRGAGGALVFGCGDCGHEREIRRCGTLRPDGGGGGALSEFGTLRTVSAFKLTGIKHAQSTNLKLVADLPVLSNNSWDAAAARVENHTTAATAAVVAANIKVEIAAAFEKYGDAERAGRARVHHHHLRRLVVEAVRPQLARGHRGDVRRTTNKCVFVETRVARCLVCMSALRRGEDEVREHEWTKTWNEREGKDGAESNMKKTWNEREEKAMAVEGANALYEAGAIVAVRRLARARACAHANTRARATHRFPRPLRASRDRRCKSRAVLDDESSRDERRHV